MATKEPWSIIFTSSAVAYVSVHTELDMAHKGRMIKMLGGEENVMKPTPLEDFLDGAMREWIQWLTESLKERLLLGTSL